MKVGIKLGKVKKFGIGWCIHHRMAADNAEGGLARPPPPPPGGLGLKQLQYASCIFHFLMIPTLLIAL